MDTGRKDKRKRRWKGGSEEGETWKKQGRKRRKEGKEWREELDIDEDLHREVSRRTRLDLLSWIHSELLRPQSPPPDLQRELRTT